MSGKETQVRDMVTGYLNKHGITTQRMELEETNLGSLLSSTATRYFTALAHAQTLAQELADEFTAAAISDSPQAPSSQFQRFCEARGPLNGLHTLLTEVTEAYHGTP